MFWWDDEFLGVIGGSVIAESFYGDVAGAAHEGFLVAQGAWVGWGWWQGLSLCGGVVDVESSLFHLHAVAGESDESFDVDDVGGFGVSEDDDFAAFGLALEQAS